MYGIGHGGAQAILLVGGTCIYNLILSWMINRSGTDILMANLSGAQMSNMQHAVQALIQTPEIFCLAGIERLVIIPLHVALSMLVWMAVQRKVSPIFFLLTVLFHALCNAPAVLYQIGWVSNLLAAEGVTAAAVLGVMILVYFEYQNCRPPRDSAK